MTYKIRVKEIPDLYIKRHRDGYDTCGELDATIFNDNEVDQVIEELFNACYAEKYTLTTEEKNYELQTQL